MPSQNAGVLDREFEAFQAGNAGFDGQTPFNPQLASPSTPLRQQSSQFASPHNSQRSGSIPLHQQSPHFASPQNSQQSSLSGWAGDFQRLQLSDPRPLQQPQFNSPAHLRQGLGGWHQEFAQQSPGGGQREMTHQSQMSGQSFGSQYSPMAQGIGMATGMGMQQYGGGMGRQMGVVQQPQPEDVFDDAAFAKAFEAAAKGEEERLEEESRQEQAKEAEPVKEEVQAQEAEPAQEVQAQVPTQELGQDVLLAESAERFMSPSQLQDPSPIPSLILDHIPDQEPIGADAIEDHRLSLQREDPDAISRTAGDLLNRVSNNTSDKFVNSQFLSFMRQLRDKEVKIEGDNVVGVETGEEVRAWV